MTVFWAGALPEATIRSQLPGSSVLRDMPGSRAALAGSSGSWSWSQASLCERFSPARWRQGHPHGARGEQTAQVARIHERHSGSGDVSTEPVQVKKRAGSCQLLMGQITAWLPALPQGEHQPAANLKAGPQLLLMSAKQ